MREMHPLQIWHAGEAAVPGRHPKIKWYAVLFSFLYGWRNEGILAPSDVDGGIVCRFDMPVRRVGNASFAIITK